MTTTTIDWDDISTDEALSLCVGWPSGQKTKLRQVSVGEDVGNAFRDVIRSVLYDLVSRTAEPWTPDADLSPETYLVLPVDQLGPAPTLATEHGGATLAEALEAAESLPYIHAADLPAASLSFYALVLGNAPGKRSIFVRRANPRRALRERRIYTALRDALVRVDEPIFAFDEFADLVVVHDQVCVLSHSVFAAMFRAQETLASQIPAWASDLRAAVPITDAGYERLITRAKRDSRLRSRLEAIVRRGHLPTVTPVKLRQKLTEAGLDSSALISPDGSLRLEDDDIPPLLQFLNEDLFLGALTDTRFRADKKASR